MSPVEPCMLVMPLPRKSHRSQRFLQIIGGVEFAARLGDAHGVKMGHAREHFGLVAVPSDDAAAVAENTDDAAVFPVGPAVLERKLENPQKIFDNILGNLEIRCFLRFLPLLQPAASGRTQNSATAQIPAGPTKGFHVLPSFTSIWL